MYTVLASHRPRIIPTCSSSSVVTLLPAWSTSQTRGLYIETLLQETYCSMGIWTAKYVPMWQTIAKMLSSIYTSCGNLIWLYSGRNISLWASHITLQLLVHLQLWNMYHHSNSSMDLKSLCTVYAYSDWRFWNGQGPVGRQLLLHAWGANSSQVDQSRGKMQLIILASDCL